MFPLPFPKPGLATGLAPVLYNGHFCTLPITSAFIRTKLDILKMDATYSSDTVEKCFIQHGVITQDTIIWTAEQWEALALVHKVLNCPSLLFSEINGVILHCFQPSSCNWQPYLCAAWHSGSERFCSHCGQASAFSYCQNNIKEKASGAHYIQIWCARRG